MIRRRLDEWCERSILALVLAVLVFGPLALGSVRAQEFAVLEWLTAGLAVLWAVRLWVNPGQPVLWAPICWAVAAFVVYAAVRYFTADVEYYARSEVLRVLVYALFFFVVTTHLSRQRWEKVVVLTLLGLAAGLALYALYQCATNTQQVWHFPRSSGYGRRGSGTYFNPNHLAGFLEMVVPLALAFTVAGRIQPATRITLGYVSALALAGIGVTISRGGWIATAIALTVFCVLLLVLRVHRAVALLLLSVLIVSGAGFIAKNRLTQERFAAMFHDGSLDNIRFQLWEPALAIWKEHPWFGAGPNHYDLRFRKHRPPGVQTRPVRAHNDYVNTLADWGLVGVALVAASFGLLFGGLIRCWEPLGRSQVEFQTVQSNRLALALGGTAGLVALLVHSLVDFNMHVPANALLAVTLMALLTGLWRHATERFWWKPGPAARSLCTALLLGAAALLVWQGARSRAEALWLDPARRISDLPKQQLLLLERAWAIEPRNPETAYLIAEAYRLQSWEGDDGYQELAEQSLPWFERAMAMQPYDPYAPLGMGIALDWIGRHDEAEPWFAKAHSLDPNNYTVLAYYGWHFVQKLDFAAAQPWLERSLSMRAWDNPVASDYLAIVRDRLRDREGK